MSARTATRSTRASRRSSTPAAGSPGSSGVSARRPQARSSAPTARSVKEGNGHKEAPVYDQLDELVGEYQRLERELADPGVHTDQMRARAIGRRYAELTPIVHAYQEWRQTVADGGVARELAAEDPSFTAEADQLERRRAELEERLQRSLVPRDPADGKDVILEVKAGEGGEESALFAGDLLRMYLRYAQRRGWQTEILDSTPSDLGGFKDVTVAAKAGRRGGPAAARPARPTTAGPAVRPTGSGEDGVWARLKHEGGVHREQRVPVNESQGRIHTSAAGVLVLPEADEVEVQIDPNDLRVDVFRSSGPGGQSVNTTDSAVRITHLPTGIVVSCQNEKSQLQNKEQALRILRARLLAEARQEADAQAAAERRSQVRTVDRSERVRTYNFPENRISDHRVGYKAYNLDQVLDGDLDGVIDALTRADTEALLAGDADPSR